MQNIRIRFKIMSIFIVFSLTMTIFLQENTALADDLQGISIEDIGKMYITTASKKPESPFRSASAVSVVTQEEIQRSGATSVAEVLRLVPGVSVSRIDSNKWAISVRGFNRQYSNKLLVLMDGRSLYNPLVSGVFWDIQDTVLADIDRIEVVRGPGASLWGANAVNGVINIITKKTQTTQGHHISALYGDYEDRTFAYRYGGKVNDDTYYRAFFKTSSKDELLSISDGIGNKDNSNQYRLGFRLDSSSKLSEKWAFWANAFAGENEQVLNLPGLTTPGVVTQVDGMERFNGFNLQGQWENENSKSSQIIKSYLDFSQRKTTNLLHQKTLTFDTEYQKKTNINDRNEFMYGLGYRFIWDETKGREINGKTYLFYDPENEPRSIFNAFLQNDYDIIADELTLTLGTKLEYNTYTNLELQPNARIAWYPSDKQTIWGAVSRAVRTPTRGERGLTSIALSTPGGFVRLSSDAERDFDSEKVTSFELGHRYKLNKQFTFDTATFYNLYHDLRTFEPGASAFNLPGTVSELIARNLGYAETFGAEMEIKYAVTSNWSLIGNYTYTKLNMSTDDSSSDFTIASEETKTPQQNVTLLSRLNLTNDLQFDTNFKFVDELEAFDVDAYTRLDMRIGWKPFEGVEVSLTGQNLLDSSHPEFQPFLFTPPAEVDRSVFIKLNLNL